MVVSLVMWRGGWNIFYVEILIIRNKRKYSTCSKNGWHFHETFHRPCLSKGFLGKDMDWNLWFRHVSGGVNIHKRCQLLGMVLIKPWSVATSIVSWCQLMFLTRPHASFRPSATSRKSSHGQTISGAMLQTERRNLKSGVSAVKRLWTQRVCWRSLQWTIFTGFHRGSMPKNHDNLIQMTWNPFMAC